MKLRHLLLGRNVTTNLDSLLKGRDITLPTKVRLVKAMVFPVVMYGCESWTTKKAEHRRMDAFELWCWRRLLRVPWTARRSNQSILKEISPGCSLEGRMLKLKLQYFRYVMWRTDSLEKTLMLRKIEGRRKRGWDGWMASPTQWTWVWVSSGSWWWTGKPGMLQSMGLQRVRHDWVTELNWTEVGQCFSSKEQASFNFMASVTIFSDLGAQQNKACHCFHCFPVYLPWSDGTRCHDLSFLNVEFYVNFFTPLFHF